jgi:hypothetical protein
MAAYFLLNSGDRIGLNAGGALLLNAQDAEPPAPEPEVPSPLPVFTGGVGGFSRRELSEPERKELLRRVRKSLGLDKEPVARSKPAPEPPSMAGPVAAAAIVVRQAARAALEADDEEVVVLAAGWR